MTRSPRSLHCVREHPLRCVEKTPINQPRILSSTEERNNGPFSGRCEPCSHLGDISAFGNLIFHHLKSPFVDLSVTAEVGISTPSGIIPTSSLKSGGRKFGRTTDAIEIQQYDVAFTR